MGNGCLWQRPGGAALGLRRLGAGCYQTEDGAWEVYYQAECQGWIAHHTNPAKGLYGDPMPTFADAKIILKGLMAP